MTYVYVPPAPSRNAQRLAEELTRVIDQHKRANPGLSKVDIEQALQIAARKTGGTSTRGALALALVAGLLLAFGVLAFFLVQRG